MIIVVAITLGKFLTSGPHTHSNALPSIMVMAMEASTLNNFLPECQAPTDTWAEIENHHSGTCFFSLYNPLSRTSTF